MDKRSVLDQKCLLYGGQYIYGEKTFVGFMEKILQTVFERLPCNSFDNFELNSVRNRQAL